METNVYSLTRGELQLEAILTSWSQLQQCLRGRLVRFNASLDVYVATPAGMALLNDGESTWNG